MRLPKFQLHLSTCIVLMFVAGGLLWANVSPRLEGLDFFDTKIWFKAPQIYDRVWGWPKDYKWEPGLLTNEFPDWSLKNLVINILTALAILTTTAVACERLLRRRKPNVERTQP